MQSIYYINSENTGFKQYHPNMTIDFRTVPLKDKVIKIVRKADENEEQGSGENVNKEQGFENNFS